MNSGLMNSFHNTIKFTFNWSSEQVNFLDVNVVLRNGIVSTDLYSKPTDKHLSTYFMPRGHSNSCRPLGYAVFVPQMLSLRSGRGSCVTTWFEEVTTRTTWKGKSMGLVGFQRRTP